MNEPPIIAVYRDLQALWPAVAPQILPHFPLIGVSVKYAEVTSPLVNLDVSFLPFNGWEAADYAEGALPADELVACESLTVASGGRLAQSSRTRSATVVVADDSAVPPPVSSSSSPPPLSFQPHKELTGKPFLGIFLLQTDSVEGFRATYRRALKQWIESCNANDCTWLVLLVTPQSETQAQERASRKLLERLRAEGVATDPRAAARGSKERLVRLCAETTQTTPVSAIQRPKELVAAQAEVLAAALEKIQECLVLSIEARYAAIDAEILRHESARAAKGSDLKPKARYSSVFFVTEELAMLHLKCGRISEALLIFQDTDLTRSVDVNPRRFRGLFQLPGFNAPDDETPIYFDTTRKPYRALIADSQISYFDFRSYFHARQQNLLIRVGGAEECAFRCYDFVRRTTQELREISGAEQGLPEAFVLPGVPSYLVWSFLSAVNYANFILAYFSHVCWPCDVFTAGGPPGGDDHQTLSTSRTPGTACAGGSAAACTSALSGGVDRTPTTRADALLPCVALQLKLWALQQLRHLIAVREQLGWPEFPRNNLLLLAADPVSEFPPCETSWEQVHRSQLLKVLSTRNRAHAAEAAMVAMLQRRAAELQLVRTSITLTAPEALSLVLRCHQYRRLRSTQPSSTVGQLTQRSRSSRSLLADLRLSSRTLRLDTQWVADDLRRAACVLEDERWCQLACMARCLACETDRAAARRSGELMSCYLLSNSAVDALCHHSPPKGSVSTAANHLSQGLHIDFPTAHTLCLLSTRGCLPSRMYFRRLLKLCGALKGPEDTCREPPLRTARGGGFAFGEDDVAGENDAHRVTTGSEQPSGGDKPLDPDNEERLQDDNGASNNHDIAGAASATDNAVTAERKRKSARVGFTTNPSAAVGRGDLTAHTANGGGFGSMQQQPPAERMECAAAPNLYIYVDVRCVNKVHTEKDGGSCTVESLLKETKRLTELQRQMTIAAKSGLRGLFDSQDSAPVETSDVLPFDLAVLARPQQARQLLQQAGKRQQLSTTNAALLNICRSAKEQHHFPRLVPCLPLLVPWTELRLALWLTCVEAPSSSAVGSAWHTLPTDVRRLGGGRALVERIAKPSAAASVQQPCDLFGQEWSRIDSLAEQISAGLSVGKPHAELNLPTDTNGQLYRTIDALVGEMVTVDLFIYSSLVREIPIDAVLLRLVPLVTAAAAPAFSPQLAPAIPASAQLFRFPRGGSDDETRMAEPPPLPAAAPVPLTLRLNTEAGGGGGSGITGESSVSAILEFRGDELWVPPGRSYVQLRSQLCLLGNYLVDSVSFVCRNCVFTQKTGELPPLERLNRIPLEVALSQTALDLLPHTHPGDKEDAAGDEGFSAEAPVANVSAVEATAATYASPSAEGNNVSTPTGGKTSGDGGDPNSLRTSPTPRLTLTLSRSSRSRRRSISSPSTAMTAHTSNPLFGAGYGTFATSVAVASFHRSLVETGKGIWTVPRDLALKRLLPRPDTPLFHFFTCKPVFRSTLSPTKRFFIDLQIFQPYPHFATTASRNFAAYSDSHLHAGSLNWVKVILRRPEASLPIHFPVEFTFNTTPHLQCSTMSPVGGTCAYESPFQQFGGYPEVTPAAWRSAAAPPTHSAVCDDIGHTLATGAAAREHYRGNAAAEERLPLDCVAVWWSQALLVSVDGEVRDTVKMLECRVDSGCRHSLSIPQFKSSLTFVIPLIIRLPSKPHTSLRSRQTAPHGNWTCSVPDRSGLCCWSAALDSCVCRLFSTTDLPSTTAGSLKLMPPTPTDFNYWGQLYDTTSTAHSCCDLTGCTTAAAITSHPRPSQLPLDEEGGIGKAGLLSSDMDASDLDVLVGSVRPVQAVNRNGCFKSLKKRTPPKRDTGGRTTASSMLCGDRAGCAASPMRHRRAHLRTLSTTGPWELHLRPCVLYRMENSDATAPISQQRELSDNFSFNARPIATEDLLLSSNPEERSRTGRDYLRSFGVIDLGTCPATFFVNEATAAGDATATGDVTMSGTASASVNDVAQSTAIVSTSPVLMDLSTGRKRWLSVAGVYTCSTDTHFRVVPPFEINDVHIPLESFALIHLEIMLSHSTCELYKVCFNGSGGREQVEIHNFTPELEGQPLANLKSFIPTSKLLCGKDIMCNLTLDFKLKDDKDNCSTSPTDDPLEPMSSAPFLILGFRLHRTNNPSPNPPDLNSLPTIQRYLAEQLQQKGLLEALEANGVPRIITSESEFCLCYELPSASSLKSQNIGLLLDAAVSEQPISIGRPIPFRITLCNHAKKAGVLRFAIAQRPRTLLDDSLDNTDAEDWLVLGMRASTCALAVNEKKTIVVSLVPLRPGILTLPTVAFWQRKTFSNPTSMSTEDMWQEGNPNAVKWISPQRQIVIPLASVRQLLHE